MSSSAFHRRITAGFVLVLVCAGLIAAASLVALRSIRVRSEAITHTYAHEVILVERLEGLTDTKAAAGRGFLMSGEEMYSQRLQAARDESDQIIGELRRSIQSREGQQQLDAIEKSEKEHQADIDAALALRRSGAKLDRVIEHWRLNAGVRREELRGAIESLRTRKQVLLEQAEQEQARSSQLLTRIVLGMATVGLLLAALLAFMLGRTLVRMYNAETAAREAADEARQWFATTLGSIGDAVIATDTHGKVTFLNPTAEMLTGWGEPEAKGKPLEEVFAIRNEKTGEPEENPVKRVLDTGVATQLANHTVLVARNGQVHPVDDSAAPIRDARRNITGVVLVFRDVSERRRAELAIRQSKEWLATTLRSIGDAVIATDNDGRITLMNPVAQRLTGWTEAHAIGAPLEAVFNIVNEETRKRLQNPVEKVLATGQVVGLANHTVLIAKDGTEWPLDDSGAPIRNSQGNIVGVVLVFREITERRRVEEALRRLGAIVESSNDAVIGKTLDGTITTWNAAAEQLYGYSAKEVVGGSISLLVPEGHTDEMPDILRRLAQGERIQHFETVRRRKDGSLISVWLNVSPIRDAVGRVVGASTIVRDITEKKRAEEALRNSEQQFRTLADAIPQLAWMANGDGGIFWYNRRWYEYTGTKPEQMAGWGWQSVHDPAALPEVLNRWRDSIATGTPFDMVFPLRGADGVFRPFLTRVMPLRDRDGKVVRWFGTNTDLSTEREAAEALRQSEARFRSIYQQAAVGIEQVGIDGRLLMVNDALCAMLGYSEEELRQHTFEEITHPDDRDRERVLLESLLAGRASQYEIEKRYLANNGASVWVSVTSSVVNDREGKPQYRVSIIQNITERKRAEEALENAFRHQRLALEAAGLGAWDYRFETGEVLWDDCCRAQFGFSPGDHVTDEAAIDRIHPEDREAVRAALRKALTGVENGAYHVEFRVTSADGSTRWIASHGRVYFSGEGEQHRPVRFIGVNSDATARKHADAAMLRSEKLASVGRLAATIAHEINNPLEAAMNALYLGLTDTSLSDSTRAFLQTADEQLGRVAQLTRQTLGFYRESKAPTLVKVPDLIEDVLGLYRRKLDDKRIAINRRYDFQDGNVCGTAGELRQVFSNLIANSLDALPRGGKLHFRVKRCSGPSGAPAVRLTIADNGTGIPPEDLGRIFEPFFTTKQAVGTGLGLWITQEIISRHGGRVTVRSRPGRGTIFWISLPAADQSKAVAATA